MFEKRRFSGEIKNWQRGRFSGTRKKSNHLVNSQEYEERISGDGQGLPPRILR